MEDKLEVRVSFANCRTCFSIVAVKNVEWRIRPRFVDRLNTVKSRVLAPFRKNVINKILAPLDVFLVDGIILLLFEVPLSDPLSSLILPVPEVVFIEPPRLVPVTRVVKAILRPFKCMHI